MTFAVIPAGGKSSRMGRPKLALPLGEKTVLEHVVAGLKSAGVDRIVVIIGPHVRQLGPLASTEGAQAIVLPEETPDMRSTVEHGLSWIEEHFHPNPEDDWLLVPADHPALEPEVVRQLLLTREEHSDCSIFVPTFEVNRGHPVLLTWSHVPAIRSLPEDAGINSYLRKQARQTCECPVDSSRILWDLDTPEDYDRLLSWWDAPSRRLARTE